MTKLKHLFILTALVTSPCALAQTETGDETQTPDDAIAADATATTFAELSPGNQQIARALMDAQVLPGDDDSTAQAWTLDEIAAAKSEIGGWGQVFNQMQSEGLIDARNLGQVVSGFQHNSAATVMGDTGALSTPGADVMTSSQVRGHAQGPGSTSVDVGANNATSFGLNRDRGSAGLNASSRSDSAIGLHNGLPVSVDHGITTATGADAAMGSSLNRLGVGAGTSNGVTGSVLQGNGLGLGKR